MGRTVTVVGEQGVVCDRCELADSAWMRLRGLMGRTRLEPGDGLMLRPASAIHTSFMRFSIDAVFLDDELQVLGVREDLRPWRTAAVLGAKAVLELAAGQAASTGLVPGTRIGMTTLRRG